jgi:hypothetical protein
VTIPEPEADNTSYLFYKKCGFSSGRLILETTLPTGKYDCPEGTYSNHIPESVIKSKPFIFGLSQASSRHMWEVANRRPKDYDKMTPTVILGDGSCIQLSYFQGNDTALALYWSSSPKKEIIKSILGLGYENGLKNIEFLFFEEHRHFFEDVPVEKCSVEFYKPVQ